MSLLYLYHDRAIDKDIQILDADSEVLTPTHLDTIRATILRLDSTALLTVTSGVDTANGSSFTKGVSNRLHLAAADIASIDPGTYTLLVDYYDGVDEAWKNVDRQVVHIEKT
jgi:hypothetical protein